MNFLNVGHLLVILVTDQLRDYPNCKTNLIWESYEVLLLMIVYYLSKYLLFVFCIKKIKLVC